MPAMNDRIWSRPFLLLLILAVCPWLGSCDESEDFSPEAPPADLIWVKVDVHPDWVDAPWTLTRVGNSFTGAGDSTLALKVCGQYKLYGGAGENLIRYPISSPQIGVVDFGDTLSFGLQYEQYPWARFYPGPGEGFWHGLCALEYGAALVCGSQDDHPRVAILDRNGDLLMDETDGGSGAFFKILPEAESGFLIGGHTTGAILLSKRDQAGAELWAQNLPLSGSVSFGDLTVDHLGGYLLLVNTLDDTPLLFPTLIRLDGAGQQLSSHDFDGPLTQIGLALTTRPGGGYYFLQLRQVDAPANEYTTELLVLNENMDVVKTTSFDTGPSKPTGSLLTCADGGVLITIESGSQDSEQTITHVIRLSSAGLKQWQIPLEMVGTQYLMACEEFGDGHFLLAGTSYTLGVPQHYSWLVELDASGEVIRNRQTNQGTGRIQVFNARMAWDGGLFIAGQYEEPDHGVFTAWVDRTGREWFLGGLPEE